MSDEWIIRTFDGGHRLVFGDEDFLEYDHCVYPDDGDGSQYREVEARMRLFAAAPDLLAALEGMLSIWQDVGGDQGNYYVEQAEAAIAKAKGGTQ